MSLVLFVIAVIFGMMLAELRISRAHEQQLLAAGAIAPPGDVYSVLAVVYPAAFLLMGAEGLWRAAVSAHDAAARTAAPSWAASGVVLFVASKALKYWAIGTLGDRWSFRVLIQPGRPLVASGPYRYVAHPNYIALVGELVSTAMMVGAVVLGPLMTAAVGAAIWARVRFERRMLDEYAPVVSATGRGPAA